MAFYVGKYPTLREFIDKVENDFDGQIGEDVDGIVTLSRDAEDGSKPFIILPENLADDDWLLKDQLRSFCNQLQLDPSDFGVRLDIG